MEQVVYLLGAGFSAPLGLPVMDNFLIRAKDIYAADPEKYKDFQNVFQTIHKLSIAKNYFNTDLFNIEEILSILDMRSQLADEPRNNAFLEMIRQVIIASTKPLPEGQKPTSIWVDNLFGQNMLIKAYAFFVAGLYGARLTYVEKHGHMNAGHMNVTFDRVAEYSIVSLNYDLVLENIGAYLETKLNCPEQFQFRRAAESAGKRETYMTDLVKLHGSVDGPDIVPPTWSKSLSPSILPEWRRAEMLLERANHIRVLGYSLPVSDTYIHYLLKATVLKNEHLKSIDVVNVDWNGKAKARFDDFVNFKYYRFATKRVEDYLMALFHAITRSETAYPMEVSCSLIEQGHEDFMKALV